MIKIQTVQIKLYICRLYRYKLYRYRLFIANSIPDAVLRKLYTGNCTDSLIKLKHLVNCGVPEVHNQSGEVLIL